MAKRFFGVLGALWVFFGLPLLVLWFGFSDQPWWALPFADLTNPVQLMMAGVLYGLPILMILLFLADQIQSRKNNA